MALGGPQTGSPQINLALVPVGSPALADSVAQRIAQAIRMGLLTPGEQLPSESVLADHLQVSNVTLREALVHLRARGLIDTKRGRGGGSFVSQVFATSPEVLDVELGAKSVAEIRDLGDEYFSFVTSCAFLAAKRADADNLVLIRRHIDALDTSLDASERSRVLSQFHIEVALATLSERLTRGMITMQSQVGELVWHCAKGGTSAATSELKRITQAISDEDAEGAHREAARHVDRVIRVVVDHRLRIERRST